MKYKVEQPIWKVTINNGDKPENWRPNGIEVTDLKILGISDYKICINDKYFSTFDFEKEGRRKDRSIWHYLNDIDVSIRTKESYFGNGVFVTLYSTKKPTKATFKKMVATACVKIDKEYGFLFSSAKDELWNMVESN